MRPSILLSILSLLLLRAPSYAQGDIRDTSIAMVAVTASYAYQIPGGDMAIRFGNPLAVDLTEVHYTYFAHADDDEDLVRHRVRQASNLLGPCGMVSMEDAAIFHRLHSGSNTPGDAIFLKGVKDEYVVPTTFAQNDESSNLPGWEHYRKLMGYEKEKA